MRLNKRLILILVAVLLMAVVSPAFAQEHGAEGGDPLSALGINLGFLISQMVNFGLIVALLTVALWRPATNMLEERSRTIQRGLEDAAAAANARRNAEAEAEKILAQARMEAQQVVEQARVRGEEVAKSVGVDARSEADRIRAEARTAAQAERDAELAGLRGQVAAISSAIAQRLIGASMDEKRQQTLINEFFTKLPADAKSLTGDVTVTSAMPLNDDEKQRVQKDLGAANVTFNVDPSILGGLVVRSGDRVIDGSVRSSLTELSSRLS
jgi:F-type H+-transporting ATPase subunit b